MSSNINKTKYNIALKSGMWYTVCNFIMKGMGFITTPIFTRLMSKEEFSDFNNFQIWSMLLMIITSLNLDASIGRAIKDYEKNKDDYLFSMVVLYFLFTVLCWGIVNGLNSLFTSLFSMNSIYINCMFLYLLFFPAIQLFQSYERYHYKYLINSVVGLVVSVLSSILSLSLVLFLKDHLLGRVIGFIVPVMIVGLIIIVYLYLIGCKVRFEYLKYSLLIVLPYIPHLISIYLLSNLDRIMIRNICGKDDMAIYSLAYTCAIVVVIFFTSANEAFGPWLADRLFKSEFDLIKQNSFLYIIFFAMIAFGITLFSPEILKIMGPADYIEARYVMPPVIAGCFLQFVYTIYVNVEQYYKKTIGMAIASLISVLINYILNYYYIRKYGYIAAAYTTFICYFLLLLLHMGLVKMLGKSMIYSNKKIIIISVFTSISIMLVSIIIDYILIRCIIMIVYFLILLLLYEKKYTQIKELLIK